MSHPQQQPPAQELQQLKQRIADLVAERESIKQAIEAGRLPPAEGLRRLEGLDETLSALDSAFKQRWDSQQQ